MKIKHTYTRLDAHMGERTRGISPPPVHQRGMSRNYTIEPKTRLSDQYLHLANVCPFIVEALEERRNAEEAPHPVVDEISNAFAIRRESDLSPSATSRNRKESDVFVISAILYPIRTRKSQRES